MGSLWGTAAFGFIEHSASHTSVQEKSDDHVRFDTSDGKDSLSQLLQRCERSGGKLDCIGSADTDSPVYQRHKESGEVGPFHEVNDSK